ncbi:MAG TPA: tetratricopeptide repeat protein [Planctomycetota bacterium]
MRGALRILAAVAALGGVVAWRSGHVLLAVAGFSGAALLLWLGRTAAPAVHPPRLQRPGDTDIFQKMERLGIPFEPGRADTKGSQVGGAAKTGLYRHLQDLEAGRWDEAAEGLDSTIDLLTKQPGGRWTQVLSVAHRLRARAHEGAGRKTEALADYERALILMPDDPEAREGKARLSG